METKVTAVNGHGHLTIGGLDTVALASKYGTPLYVMDEDAIRANCRALKNSMDAHYHKKGLVLYASKAFCCKRMYRILNEEGLGADVVSGGELYTALQAGFPAERIYFHGNNKTADELTMALESGVGRIVVDNIAELELLEGDTKSCRVTVPDHQLSLAIGNKGQNARLCARLTGYNIDIRPESGYYGEEPPMKKTPEPAAEE